MNYYQAMDFISGFSHLGKKVTDLSRIAELLRHLENPQNKLRFVHVAGTNGKGSVVELCSNAAINAGYKTGQFTSPFIKCYEDRIRINNHNIPKQKVADICEKVKSAISDAHYSQFEITFAIALLYWLEEKCDIVFLETGLGGLLDATNIIKNPLVTVITSVSYDHETILGNTIQKIARQKAGIIKQNVPNILSMGNCNECIKKVSEIAQYMHSELIIPKEADLSAINMNIDGSHFIYKNQNYFIKMNGMHQIQNACTSIECINQLNNKGFSISYNDIKKSLAEVQIAGRTEIISKNPLVILDGSHNLDGVNALFAVTSKIKSPVIAVLGILKRKDYEMIAEAIEGDFRTPSNISEIVCVDGFLDENIKADELAEMFENIPTYSMNYKNGYDFAVKKASDENKAVAVFGSLFLVTELKEYIENNSSK
jgi:dihydrofolate synthase/folylpolyglutamate synthase